MKQILILISFGVLGIKAQDLVDDFTCPDEFEGYYPHLYFCDNYWACKEGVAELRKCGNGLAFVDTDKEYRYEICEEYQHVECGDRTELEPPISAPNCPRLYGTFPDPEDCGYFWKCRNGGGTRQQCPPGLAYDTKIHKCTWISDVPECYLSSIPVGEEEQFSCPEQVIAGAYTKHINPLDCRKFFLCISGVPRDQECPEGEVFDVGTGNGIDGKCTDPENVPECADYYAEVPDVSK